MNLLIFRLCIVEDVGVMVRNVATEQEGSRSLCVERASSPCACMGATASTASTVSRLTGYSKT